MIHCTFRGNFDVLMPSVHAKFLVMDHIRDLEFVVLWFMTLPIRDSAEGAVEEGSLVLGWALMMGIIVMCNLME